MITLHNFDIISEATEVAVLCWGNWPYGDFYSWEFIPRGYFNTAEHSEAESMRVRVKLSVHRQPMYAEIGDGWRIPRCFSIS